jgi:NADP-dependent 3-hydroxy acid dehydrogenase YdfG
MSGKVALITGAGSGIGQLMARRALDAGWKVAALDIHQTGLDALGERRELLKLTVDVTDPSAVADAAERIERELGSIDRVVNAAAIMPLGLLTEQSGEIMHRAMAINFGGLVNVTKAVLPRLLARGRGEFVSFASMAGHWPLIYMGAYDATKHAVVAFTEVFHHETKNSGVRTICVCPPIVATPLLKQAKDTTWPKIFDVFAPITSEQVVDAIDKKLSGSGFWVFPGPLTRISWIMRRWMPGLMWRFVHLIEKR